MLENERSRLKLNGFMNMCEEVAKFSYDPKIKVGSIIITQDFREICALGYNGNYKGGPNARDSLEIGQSGFLHSEENALMHLCKPFEIRENLILLCTHEPCPMCAKRIVNSGIKNVLFKNEYRALGNQTEEIFRICKVQSIKL